MLNSALQQSPIYTDILRARGVHAFADANGTQMIARGPVVAVFRGIRPPQSRRAIIMHPDTDQSAALRAAGFRQIMTPATIAQMDLIAPTPPHPKWQRACERARNAIMKVEHRPLTTNDHWIFHTDRDQQRIKGYRALPHDISARWPPEKTLFSVAICAGRPIAAMLFLRHGNGATYQIGWSGPTGRAQNAHHRLLVGACAELKKLGATSLDLGLVDTDNCAGLARFKLRSGATPRRLGGTWLRLPRWRS